MSAQGRGRLLIFWGRGLFVGGLVGALASAAPALLLLAFPRYADVFGTLAVMLTLSVTPLMVLAASAGAILLLAGALRRWRDRP